MELKTKNIGFEIDKKEILKNINIDIRNKEFVGIIGPNGSGKSTLLKCIYRNLKPSKGSIYIDNKNIMDMSIKESSKKIGVVSQHNYHSFDFSVLDMVLMGRAPYKKLMERDTKNDFDIVYEAIDKVNIRHLIDRSFNSLSGGGTTKSYISKGISTKYKVLDIR